MCVVSASERIVDGSNPLTELVEMGGLTTSLSKVRKSHGSGDVDDMAGGLSCAEVALKI